MSEAQSMQLDENWRPIYPQDVPVGGIMRSPHRPPGYYVTFRRVETNDPNTSKFDHATPGRVQLQKRPGAPVTDFDILNELSVHLERATEWAHPDNLAPPGEWSCVSSTLEAVNQGNLGLALTRWGDLSYSDNMPLLSPEAENWKKS